VLRIERFFLTDEQSLIPRSLVSFDRTCNHGGSSGHPALRAEQSGSRYRIPE
jgi:hypothetical protein